MPRDLPTLMQRINQAENRRDCAYQMLLDLEDALRREHERWKNGWITRDEYFDVSEIIGASWRTYQPVYSHAWREALALSREADRLVLA